jgi:Oxysterol-binding protein
MSLHIPLGLLAHAVLGETWQASLSGGINVWLEQISHHPPVSAYQMTVRKQAVLLR